MFSPFKSALDLNKRLRFNRLYCSPLELGAWALLEPAGVQNHAPQLCWIRKDLLGCVWMAGGQEGTSGMGIMFSTLKNNASGWKKPKLISQDPSRSEQNPLLFITNTDGKNRLQLIHTAQCVRQNDNDLEEDEAFSMQWTASLRQQNRATNQNRWSKVSDLVDYPAFCRHPPHCRKDGKWLLPIYKSLAKGGAFGHDHSEILILEANGKATNEVIEIPESTGRVHGSIVLSADGSKLLQFFRSRLADRIYRSTGTLDGMHWSKPTPTNLPNNNSSIQALRLTSGRLAMIFNRFSLEEFPVTEDNWGDAQWPRTRWPLSIGLSNDDGDTWPWIRDIDYGYGFNGEANWMLNGQLAYPTLIEGIPGELHIAYSWAGRQAIRYMCINEREIMGLPFSM